MTDTSKISPLPWIKESTGFWAKDGHKICYFYSDADGDYTFEAVNSHERLKAENERLRSVLTSIAMFEDTYASEILALRGSYAAFDEPGSVELARNALKET